MRPQCDTKPTAHLEILAKQIVSNVCNKLKFKNYKSPSKSDYRNNFENRSLQIHPAEQFKVKCGVQIKVIKRSMGLKKVAILRVKSDEIVITFIVCSHFIMLWKPIEDDKEMQGSITT